MNISDNGKLIQAIYLHDGTACRSEDNVVISLEAIYHGDRDEFWAVVSDSFGKEISRYNLRYIVCIDWM